jgi:hypothetical protein
LLPLPAPELRALNEAQVCTVKKCSTIGRAVPDQPVLLAA